MSGNIQKGANPRESEPRVQAGERREEITALPATKQLSATTQRSSTKQLSATKQRSSTKQLSATKQLSVPAAKRESVHVVSEAVHVVRLSGTYSCVPLIQSIHCHMQLRAPAARKA